ncbi:(S)-ureidoglycine aminohydrolase [Thioclava sediminum]|uniref:(S)-ureidoglycine aminohydrolase n=1 Tax=Thioclava sediminum TaxID=1915319 RepID=A0ABX3N2N6_9RHOB|nr:bifunctional allantoicase/(S)-ureidoglycine aminohydrolase [Thioclava sediminum]OOY26145.1 (S)-ureidoglycine aminohydrolase [Thioclava sediminum]
MEYTYYAPTGGLPDQNQRARERAQFNTSYAVIPRGVLSDITISLLPGWQNTRAWVLARPLSGFAETFAELVVEVAPGGGSDNPEPDPEGQSVIFVLAGHIRLVIEGVGHELDAGGYAYLAPGAQWSVANDQDTPGTFVWVRKRYERVPGIDAPESFVTADQDKLPLEMPNTSGYWSTSRFVDPNDLRHDMHVNIVTFMPGGTIPFAETHVMEHGIFVLQGRGVYLLNQDWIEVEEGDFMWLRAFCPQACYAAGRRPFRYLLYKDVNRHPKLGSPFPG